MSAIQYPPDVLSQLADMQRRISALEREGSTPASTRVVDDSNNLRLFEGQLDGITGKVGGATYTYPTGTYGITVMDASGNILFDSLGLTGVSSVLNSTSGTATTFANNTTPQQMTATNTTFTLTRAATVWLLGTATMSWVLAAGEAGVNVGVVGQGNSLTQKMFLTLTSGSVNSWETPVTCSLTVALPAGSYTAAFFGYENGSSLGQLVNWDLHVFRFGG